MKHVCSNLGVRNNLRQLTNRCTVFVLRSVCVTQLCSVKTPERSTCFDPTFDSCGIKKVRLPDILMWYVAGLRRGSAAARLLGLRVRILPGAWMSVCCECCVLSGRGLCDEIDHSFRGVLPTVVCRCVWSGNLVNEGALDPLGGGLSGQNI